ncbi:hypothetical protein BJP36_37205 [Moorena producens JHB]|uniref:Uncharacterized protein n=1 Tax=Moorena producens (strain JHB) TaxID=1454205 RepID=A0A9Q9SU66_MOOP1|nr:hypothetical protein [Moorena producens]WAN69732.1 hypothetical protein BJP36_37205 [Moorena producens JHB]
MSGSQAPYSLLPTPCSNALEAIANYSGIFDAGFDVIPVKPSPLDTVGGNPIPLLI